MVKSQILSYNSQIWPMNILSLNILERLAVFVRSKAEDLRDRTEWKAWDGTTFVEYLD